MNMRMMSVCQFFKEFWNDPRSGLLQRSGGRLFQSLAVLGKNEYLCMFILDRLNVCRTHNTSTIIYP